MAEKKEVKDANSKRTKFHEIWSWKNTEIKFEKLPTRFISFNTKIKLIQNQKEQIENMNELELCGAPRPSS